MVSTHPLLSKSSSFCIISLLTVLRTPITIGITITFMSHSFFSSLARSEFVSHFSLSFSFTMGSAGTVKSTIHKVFFLLLTRRTMFVFMIEGRLQWVVIKSIYKTIERWKKVLVISLIIIMKTFFCQIKYRGVFAHFLEKENIYYFQ